MSTAVAAAQELGAFLRTRRERTRPEDLGFEPGPRRKVTGLRREEVAVLTGLSTDYYQRLEQGRNIRPSDAVLDALTEALGLNAVEQRHLMALARLTRQEDVVPDRTPDRVPQNTRVLLSTLSLPAVVLSRHLDVLAWNSAAEELLGDPLRLPAHRRNALMVLFHEDGSRLRCEGWEQMANDYIGMLRAATVRDPGHPRAVEIVGELSIASADFRRLWAQHDVRESVHGAKTIRHPRLGGIDVEWDAYPLPGSPGPVMMVFTPQPGHEERIRMLGR